MWCRDTEVETQRSGHSWKEDGEDSPESVLSMAYAPHLVDGLYAHHSQ